MNETNIYLTPDEIKNIFPKEIIINLIRGFVRTENVPLGVMLDVDDYSPTGKIHFYFEDDFTSYCKLNRKYQKKVDVNLCAECTRNRFEIVKNNVIKDINYKGENIPCQAGGMVEFVVPIVEKVSKTFIGVIFGGQKRQKENILQVIKRGSSPI